MKYELSYGTVKPYTKSSLYISIAYGSVEKNSNKFSKLLCYSIIIIMVINIFKFSVCKFSQISLYIL